MARNVGNLSKIVEEINIYRPSAKRSYNFVLEGYSMFLIGIIYMGAKIEKPPGSF